jgi:hypothetical protein
MTPRDVRLTMRRLERKLNTEIGFMWWKKYVAAAFWSNVSTPINLAITLMTALTTAQATTENLLPERTYVSMSISALVLSVLNTFFRPHVQMSDTIKTMNEWAQFGNRFERIYYSNFDSFEDWTRRSEAYTQLQHDLHAFQSASQTPDSQNFLTDLVHILAHITCLRGREHWLEMDEDEGDQAGAV